MTFNIIATGSGGNAALINSTILIDCGATWKKLKPYADQIRLVLLTHAHSDHFKPSTVRALHKQHPAIRFGCCEWMVSPLFEAGVDKRRIDVYEHDLGFITYGEFSIEPVALTHDVPNGGYKIISLDGGVFYATDCATLDGIEAKNYDLYMIESNHLRDEIDARIEAKRAAGEYAYELEAKRNHMSQEQALDWLASNAGPNSKYVFLHQHNGR